MSEINLFEKPDVAQRWVEMLSLDHSDPGKSDRIMVVYPYILEWLETNKITNLVDIGSGDGYLGSIVSENISYVGIEPSKYLFDVSKKQYIKDNLEYRLGSAYNSGLDDEKFEGAVSVMVWFHLADLSSAAKELQRILRPGGKFLILTSNSLAIEIWKSFYQDPKVEGITLTGKFMTPHSVLEESIIYVHSNDVIAESLKKEGLVVENILPIGIAKEDDKKIIVAISGYKP